MRPLAPLRFLVLALIALGAPTAQGAEEGLRYSARISYAGTIELPRGRLSGTFLFDVTIDISTLLGEPLVACTASYSGARDVALSASLPQGERVIALSREQVASVTFYALELRLAPAISRGVMLGLSDSRVYCDAGIVGSPTKEPFNVAGSPDWDGFICRGLGARKRKCGQDTSGGAFWAGAADAREIYGLMREAGAYGDIEIHRLKAEAGKVLTDIAEAQLVDGATAVYEDLIDDISARVNRGGSKVDYRKDMTRLLPGWWAADGRERIELMHGFHELLTVERRMRDSGLDAATIAALLEATAPVVDRHLEAIAATRETLALWDAETARVAEVSKREFQAYRNSLKPLPRGAQGPFAFFEERDGQRMFGFRTADGQVVLPVRETWRWASDFAEGIAVVWLADRSFRYVDVTGGYLDQGLLDRPFTRARVFSDGIGLVAFEDQDARGLRPWIVIDRNGQKLAEIVASDATAFGAGLAGIKVSGTEADPLWYYHDARGRRVLGPYAHAGRFSSEGYALVNKQDVIDRTGRVLLTRQDASIVHGRFVLAQGSKPGTKEVIDLSTGAVLIPETQDAIIVSGPGHPSRFEVMQRTVLASQQPDCRNDGWIRYRLDIRVLDTGGRAVAERSEEVKEVTPNAFCLISRP